MKRIQNLPVMELKIALGKVLRERFKTTSVADRKAAWEALWIGISDKCEVTDDKRS